MGSVLPRRMLRIGVDVGGTNTDAVMLDVAAVNEPNRGVLAAYKTPTTSPSITDGIETAVGTVLNQAADYADEVSCLIIGTTHFLNAVIERDQSRLSRVAVIRLTKSFTKGVPPFSDFPPQLANILHGYVGFADGGLHIDGSQEASIKEQQLIDHCYKIRDLGITAIVLVGVFSPIDTYYQQELAARKIVQKTLPDVDVVCSSEVSGIGLLERENASILNAAILDFARRTIRGFRMAMKRLNLNCSLFISQNDGTVIDAALATRLPVKTFSSGPTNSMRGAAYLGLARTGGKDETRVSTVVVDVGGTTTDCGMLLPSGFPRAAPAYVTVAGVTINFPMPHLESIGLGGGSLIHDSDSETLVGPDSVGYALQTKAKVFGGDILTTTDIAVAAGKVNIGDHERVSDVSAQLIEHTQARIKKMLERVIDRLKISPEPLPLLLVGGGSVICPTELDGVSEVIIPKYHSYANAVGAAIARVGGTVDKTFDTESSTLADIVEQAKLLAMQKAIDAGADPATVTIAEIETFPIPYMSGQIRVVARAVGDLSNLFVAQSNGYLEEEYDDDVDETGSSAKSIAPPIPDTSITINFDTYRPNVETVNGVPEWHVSETDLEWIRDGCYILGCAGGGSPKAEYLKLRDQVRAGHTVRIIDSSHLKEDALIYCE